MLVLNWKFLVSLETHPKVLESSIYIYITGFNIYNIVNIFNINIHISLSQKTKTEQITSTFKLTCSLMCSPIHVYNTLWSVISQPSFISLCSPTPPSSYQVPIPLPHGFDPLGFSTTHGGTDSEEKGPDSLMPSCHPKETKGNERPAPLALGFTSAPLFLCSRPYSGSLS